MLPLDYADAILMPAYAAIYATVAAPATLHHYDAMPLRDDYFTRCRFMLRLICYVLHTAMERAFTLPFAYSAAA